ncbi:hypothetical protein U9M48_019692 [Paspalum notatum var. saurae]|uniref:Uncharacterized protein n=1 Tax=Paspalum notatum var. saurae TaxID=547442 RepID=A0AAQ3WRS4_PASNO
MDKLSGYGLLLNPACKELSTREKPVIKEPDDRLYPERRRRVADLIRPRFKGLPGAKPHNPAN